MSNTYLYIYIYIYRSIVWSTSRISSISFSLSLSLLAWETKKIAIDKRDNSYTLRLLSFSMFHRDHFLSFVCAPIVQQYLSLSSKRHRSSPTVIVVLFISYRTMIRIRKVSDMFFFGTCFYINIIKKTERNKNKTKRIYI